MAIIHFLNVLEGDCNIIQHDSQRVTVMDISNAYNQEDTPQEKAVKESRQREEIRTRTRVPSNKVDYKQNLSPDNPIDYLRENVKTRDIFRFIISHPDMDHMDGIKDLFTEFPIYNTWDTDNNKTIKQDTPFAGYNPDDWSFYTQLRAGQYANTRRLTYYDETLPVNSGIKTEFKFSALAKNWFKEQTLQETIMTPLMCSSIEFPSRGADTGSSCLQETAMITRGTTSSRGTLQTCRTSMYFSLLIMEEIQTESMTS